MNHIERLQLEHSDASSYAAAYVKYVAEILTQVRPSAVAAFINLLLDAQKNGALIFFLGNGGSAATASHFANDLAIGTRSWLRPFRALSLADNVSVMTAVANDYGYDQMFVRQLEALCRPGDVVVALSASGNSPNVLAAIGWASEHGAKTVGLTGFDGGQLANMVQLNVHVPTGQGEYGPVEDAHMVIDHLVGSFLLGLITQQRER